MQRRQGLARQSFLIVVVCVAVVGGLVLLAILLRVLRSCRARTNPVPLPPIQPLAHQREHQLTQFEASLHNDGSAFLAPRPPRSSHFDSTSSSLLGSVSAPRDESDDLALLTPREPESPLPALHSSNPSYTNLSDSPRTSPSNTPAPSSAPSSFSRSLPRLNRDDQSRPHHHRPLSLSSSLSRSNSRRGLPHGPNSHVQIILPAPLAPGIAPTPSLYEPDSPSERMSIVDRWVPAGRDSIASRVSNQFCTVLLPMLTTSSQASTAPRTPRRVSSNPNNMMAGPQININHRQYPSMPDVGRQHVPPVPRVPSIYGRARGSEEDKGRNLNKRVE